MKLIQIQYFLTIEAHTSITRAAEQLFVLQPAVTKQMNLLEEELRIGCFDGAVTDDFLPKLYAGLKASTPRLHIKLMRQSIKENRKALDADDIDVLIEPACHILPQSITKASMA